MSPFKVALWIVKFVLSLLLFASIGYGIFLFSLLGIAKTADVYKEHKLTRYTHNVEVCVQKHGGDFDIYQYVKSQEAKWDNEQEDLAKEYAKQQGPAPNVIGMVSDPEFQKLSPDDQQATLGQIDPEFGKLSSDDFVATVGELQKRGYTRPDLVPPPGVAKPGDTWEDAAKEYKPFPVWTSAAERELARRSIPSDDYSSVREYCDTIEAK